MTDEYCNIFQESIDVVHRYAKCLAKDSNCDVQQDWVELSDIMMYLCEEKEKWTLKEEVYSDFIDEIGSTVTELDDKDIIGKYNEYINKGLSNLKPVQENEEYNEFKNLICNNMRNPQDESGVTAVVHCISAIDPITKLPLTDPVKNIKCGHTYEKESIFQLLKTKKTVKCPIPGCIAACSVEINDLVPDRDMKRYLALNRKP